MRCCVPIQSDAHCSDGKHVLWFWGVWLTLFEIGNHNGQVFSSRPYVLYFPLTIEHSFHCTVPQERVNDSRAQWLQLDAKEKVCCSYMFDSDLTLMETEANDNDVEEQDATVSSLMNE